MAQTIPDLLTLASKLIQEEMTILEKDCIMGHSRSYDDYRFACGIYRGLLIANGILSDAYSKHVSGGEDDDD